MSTSLNQTQTDFHSEKKEGTGAGFGREQWLSLLFWAAVVLLIVGAVVMRLYHLDVRFDRDSYDEGVYWQSLRAMLAGQSLYHPLFYSQPPAFLFSVFPSFALFGGSLWSARFGIVLVSLLGFPGAYLLGKGLSGRLGALAALLLLLANSLYLSESQTIQAEAPSVAFTFLVIGFAFLWWKQPDGRRGICWAALTGITLVLSILSKLLWVSTLVPVGLLMLTRIWQIWHKQSGTSNRSWLPILFGVGFALLTLLFLVLPFFGSFQDFWSSVVTFHETAAQDSAGTMSGNYHILKPTLVSLLGFTALYGTLTAFLRRDWRVLPLLGWFLATFVLLLRQYPLFDHHLITLEPPLIVLAVLGVAKPGAQAGPGEPSRGEPQARQGEQGRGEPQARQAGLLHFRYHRGKLDMYACIIVLGVLLVLVTAVTGFQQDVRYYQAAEANDISVGTQQDLHVASDLRRAISSDQWVITDGQFIAGLADRNTPPELVDTSGVRINTGYLTLAQLEQAAANPRVHAVLFYTGRFYLPNVAGFHAWVAQHFHLLRSYNSGQELWVR